MWTHTWPVIRSVLILPVCLVLGLAGCNREPERAVIVTDSAGVRITISIDSPRVFAEVDPQPVLSLGGPDASGPTQFYRIQHVLVGPSGNLWVADGQSGELRIFRPDGTHLETIGGLGEGPGEFVRIRLLDKFNGDSVAVWDDANARLTVFDAEGGLTRTTRVSSGDTPLPRAFDVYRDGTILAQIPRVLSAGALEPGQLLSDTARLVRMDPEDSKDDLQAQAPGPVWLWTGHSQVPIPFTINASFDVHDAAIYLVAGPVFRVRVFQDGRLSEVFGVDRAPRRITQDDVRAYEEFTEEFIPQPQRREYLSALSNPSRPKVLPAYSRVLLSPDGEVWTQVYSPDFLAPSTWDVYSAGHEWLGHVDTPGGFTVTSVMRDGLVGVWRDDVGVEHVRVYRIRPG